jgi:hypothetical protein
MQPGKTSATLLFSAPTQYVIPVFQRGYVWTLEKQVAPLWADVADRANALLERKAIEDTPGGAQLGPMRKHFLGSLVLTPVINAFGRVSAYEVIDGQQRTTTLHLLLLAFRDVAKKHGDPMLLQMLENLTRNAGPFSVLSDHHKVWPTKAGREEISALNGAGDVAKICVKFPVRLGKGKVERPLLVQGYLYLYHGILAFLRGADLGQPVSSESDVTHADHLIHGIRHDAQVEAVGAEQPIHKGHAEVLFMALQNEVQLMTLTLETEDDPQIIFETLNARGEPLLASDLIRNFIFLEATRKDLVVDDLYATYWKDFDEQVEPGNKITSNRYWRERERQGRITHPRIDLFFFHYTILRRVSETKVGNVFQNYKDWWLRSVRDLTRELSAIRAASMSFRSLVSPVGEGRIQEFARLVKALDVSTFIPVFLRLVELYPDEGSKHLRQAIVDLESYIVRRTVCGFTTKNYNRIALKLLEALNNGGEPATALRTQLQAFGGASQSWPGDDEFREAWLNRPVYEAMRAAKVAAILRALEPSFRTSKQEDVPVPVGLTVEHVLPQEWKKHGFYPIPDMTEEKQIARDRLLHTFGNLTLLTQPLNSSASNGPFEDFADGGKIIDGKRKKICESLLSMNAYFQSCTGQAWDNEAINARGKLLFHRALSMWQRPAEIPKPSVAEPTPAPA